MVDFLEQSSDPVEVTASETWEVTALLAPILEPEKKYLRTRTGN